MSNNGREEDTRPDFAATLDANRVQQDKVDLSKPALLEKEVRHVTLFVKGQQESLELAAKALFVRANTLATTGTRTTINQSSVQESYATLHYLKQSTRTMVNDCLLLQEFYTNNRRVLLEHAAAHHASLETSSYLPQAHLNSSLVCVLSDIYQALRQAEERIQNNAAGDTSLWEAPSSFKRSTTKYWVKDENLTKLMMYCVGEAPLLVYGKKGPLTSTKPADLQVSEGDKLWETLATRVNSIYFDSPDMSLYRERIKRNEGAQLLRARWYGPHMPKGHQTIFLELKTHHEKWVAQKSIKERATIQEDDMVDFLAPVRWQTEDAERMILRAKPKLKDKDAEELAKQTGLLLRMHNLCVKHKLDACVRTVYDRAAFQSAKSNDLRLTLDRNVTVVNERVKELSSGQWCLTDSEAQTARSSVVPFNVFEVKLAGDDPMPPGLAQAESDSTMILANKFSKFLTGAAAFNVVPILPYWAAHPAFYSFFELDRRAGRTPLPESDDTSYNDYALMDLPSNTAVAGAHRIPKGIVIAPKTPARIEPKTYFANERTFVQWISASILLLSVSGFMLQAGSAGDFKTTAAAISLSALVLVVYSTGLYFKRLKLLKSRQSYGYYSKANPIFLTSVVGIAIFLVWADSIKGSEFLEFFSFTESRGDDRRLLPALLTGLIFDDKYEKCSQEIVATNLSVNKNPSSLVVDSKRHSFLLTSGESVYIQPMSDDESIPPSKANHLIRINQSNLQGLAIVGNRLFAVSDGPERTELIELAWWGPHDGNERLRVAGRWTLDHSRSRVNGFSFVPTTDTAPTGSFYINMNSSIHVFSLPARSDAHPMRLKTLNMKVLTQGMTAEETESNDRLSTMVTFEGTTYILRSGQNVLESWNLADGTPLPAIGLPAPEDDHSTSKWTGFALERRITTSTETPNVRGGKMPETGSSAALFLHLMTGKSPYESFYGGGQVWRFPVHGDVGLSGLILCG